MKMVISRYLGMFSLDCEDRDIIDPDYLVISRYLGMFSLDHLAYLYDVLNDRYFPLSWDVLIRCHMTRDLKF